MLFATRLAECVRRLAPRTGVIVLALLLGACGGHSALSPTASTVDGAAAVTPTSTPPAATATIAVAGSTTTTALPTPSSTPPRAAPTAVVVVDTATSIPAPTATATATLEPCPGAIAWDAAAAHVGQIVTVRGPVVDATFASESRGQPTFLNIGRGYPDPARFTVVIWIPNRANFPAPPEELYSGQTVCVTGQVTLYNGAAEMEIIGPEDIQTT